MSPRLAIGVWYLFRLSVLSAFGTLMLSLAPDHPVGAMMLIGAALAWVAVSTTQSHGPARGSALGLVVMAAWAWVMARTAWRTAGFTGAQNAQSWLLIMLLLDAVALVFALVARQAHEELE